MRWSGKGHFKTKDNYTVYFSGSQNGGRAGVAFILTPNMAKAVLGYNPMNERLMSIRLQCKPISITLICNYSPTSAADETELETHYNNLQNLIDITSKTDAVIVFGDFNSKIGQTSVNKEVMGDSGLGTMNEQGTRLIEFCQENQFCIMNTMFDQHPR